MYADDTSVTCFAEDIDELGNDPIAVVENITEWLRHNKLSLNTDKTEYVAAGYKRHTHRFI